MTRDFCKKEREKGWVTAIIGSSGLSLLINSLI